MLPALNVSDISCAHDDLPRIAHTCLAKALGYGSPHKLAHLINRHRPALEQFGAIPSTVDGNRTGRGRRLTILWPNKKQALFVCTKAETPNATDITIQMVEVFDAFMSARPHAPANDTTHLRFGVRAGHHVVKAPDSDHYPFIVADLDLLVREAWEPIFDIWTPESLLLAQHAHSKKKTVLWLTEHGGLVYRRVGHQFDMFSPAQWNILGRVVGVCLSDGAVLPLAPELTQPDPVRPVEAPAGCLPIDRGIPVPDPLPGQQRKFPFALLQVGESFFAPGRTARSVGGALWSAAQHTGFRFTSRTEKGGVRVWRIE